MAFRQAKTVRELTIGEVPCEYDGIVKIQGAVPPQGQVKFCDYPAGLQPLAQHPQGKAHYCDYPPAWMAQGQHKIQQLLTIVTLMSQFHLIEGKSQAAAIPRNMKEVSFPDVLQQSTWVWLTAIAVLLMLYTILIVSLTIHGKNLWNWFYDMETIRKQAKRDAATQIHDETTDIEFVWISRTGPSYHTSETCRGLKMARHAIEKKQLCGFCKTGY